MGAHLYMMIKPAFPLQCAFSESYLSEVEI